MKKIYIAAVGILPLFMSGCATSILYLHENKSQRDQGVLLQDQLIAVGVPAKPIKGYENALVIAGNQYSYLVKPSTNQYGLGIQQPVELTKILNEVDLNYLAVGQLERASAQKDVQMQETISSKFIISVNDSKKVINHTIKETKIYFIYNKPQSLIKSGEIEHLQSLGFKCEVKESENRCLKEKYVDITIAKPISNEQPLKHVLRRPLDLNVRYLIYKNKPSVVAQRIVLTPLSVAFDIVTIPIQLIGLITFVTFY